MKKLLLIGTGGTIASVSTSEGLTPGISAAALLESVPSIRGAWDVNWCQPVNLDSTNMRPGDWLTIARRVREQYDAYDGFVVTHGTDTMAYTAAALSYLIRSSPKPIVLTGAQKSISLTDTDARTNLLDAFAYAADNSSSGVTIVFDGRVITGTRARKIRTRSRNAFESVDFPELALVREGKILRYFTERKPDGPAFSDALDSRVAAIKLTPGMNGSILDMLMDGLDALVLEGFGMGGIPDYEGGGYAEALMRWRDAGKVVAVTTQVPYEGSDLSLYEVGRRALMTGGVIEAYSMTSESAVVKLMWILAKTRDIARVHELFHTPVAHDILLMNGDNAL